MTFSISPFQHFSREQLAQAADSLARRAAAAGGGEGRGEEEFQFYGNRPRSITSTSLNARRSLAFGSPPFSSAIACVKLRTTKPSRGLQSQHFSHIKILALSTSKGAPRAQTGHLIPPCCNSNAFACKIFMLCSIVSSSPAPAALCGGPARRRCNALASRGRVFQAVRRRGSFPCEPRSHKRFCQGFAYFCF